MSFALLFRHSNTSCYNLRGNVVYSSIEHTRGDMVFLDTGLKSSTVCFRSELTISRQKEQDTSFTIVGIDNVELFGEPKLILPKTLSRKRKRLLVWDKLTKVWNSPHNRIRGFIMNSVKGGYAVAIAGYTAFLPRSLRQDYVIFTNQWRRFSICNMKPQIRNIVVKELASSRLRALKTRKFSSTYLYTKSVSALRMLKHQTWKHNHRIKENNTSNRNSKIRARGEKKTLRNKIAHPHQKRAKSSTKLKVVAMR